MNNGKTEEFDGLSLIKWSNNNKIEFLKEYGCNLNNYNPYKSSDTPKFRKDNVNWFQRKLQYISKIKC